MEDLLLELIGMPFFVYGLGILMIVNSEGSMEAIAGGILWMALGTVVIVILVMKKIKKRSRD